MQWKLSGILADVNGSFGGSTVFEGRTGLIMRNVRKGKNPRSSGQLSRRGQFTTATQAWRGLSDVRLAAWKEAAKLMPKKGKVGQSYSSTGAALYSAVNDSAAFVNYCRSLVGAGIVVVLPVDDVPSFAPPTPSGNIANLVAKNVGGVQTLTVDMPTVATDNICIMEATPPLSNGRSNFKGQYRPIAAFIVSAPVPATDILPYYQAVFGDLIAGKRLSLRVRYYNSVGKAPCSKTGQTELAGAIKAI